MNHFKNHIRDSFFSLVAVGTLIVISGVGSFWPNRPGLNEATIGRLTPVQCGYTTDIPPVQDYGDLVTISDPYLGNYDAVVTVIEYFDPNCSYCKSLHPVMQQLISKYADRVRFFMIPYVLWPHSMAQIEALYITAQEGKYYDMLDAQYNVQKSGGLSLYELRQIAAELDVDPDQLQARLERGLYRTDILSKKEQIKELGVSGTPTLVINGRFITDSDAKTVECLSRLIEEALKASD